MSYNLKLAERIRQRLSGKGKVEEKAMMGGLTFMVQDKMCVGIIKDELMCRVNPDKHEELTTIEGCRTMDFTKRPMKGYVMIHEKGMKTDQQFDFWIEEALAFNKLAKSSKSKKSGTGK